MKSIYKYSFYLSDLVNILLPKNSTILKVAYQNGLTSPQVWALIDTDELNIETRILRIYGTGQPIIQPIEKLRFIDTLFQGDFVWHVFEERT